MSDKLPSVSALFKPLITKEEHEKAKKKKKAALADGWSLSDAEALMGRDAEGKAENQTEERRKDANDGWWYTKEEFEKRYCSTREWENATSSFEKSSSSMLYKSSSESLGIKKVSQEASMSITTKSGAAQKTVQCPKCQGTMGPLTAEFMNEHGHLMGACDTCKFEFQVKFANASGCLYCASCDVSLCRKCLPQPAKASEAWTGVAAAPPAAPSLLLDARFQPYGVVPAVATVPAVVVPAAAPAPAAAATAAKGSGKLGMQACLKIVEQLGLEEEEEDTVVDKVMSGDDGLLTIISAWATDSARLKRQLVRIAKKEKGV